METGRESSRPTSDSETIPAQITIPGHRFARPDRRTPSIESAAAPTTPSRALQAPCPVRGRVASKDTSHLRRTASPDDIAEACLAFVTARYATGKVLLVGRRPVALTSAGCTATSMVVTLAR